MICMAVAAGLVGFGALTWLGRRLPSRPVDIVEQVFRLAAGGGLAVLAAAAVYEGAPAGALLAAIVAAMFAMDVPALWGAARPDQSATVTPFQKAT